MNNRANDDVGILLTQVAGFLADLLRRDDQTSELTDHSRIDVERAHWRARDALSLYVFSKYTGNLTTAERMYLDPVVFYED